MKDLTQGSIPRHVVAMAIPIAMGMLVQTLYFFVDLYFVSRLGDAAIAGVTSGGNLMFAVFALTQMLGVGTVAMVSHAVGRKDRPGANHVFNQAVGLAALCAGVTLLGGYAIARPYMAFLGADAATTLAGTRFLEWLLPGLALQFAIVVMSSGLRGTGIVKPAMVVQAVTVLINAMLAPVLIAGWGTGRALGVAGAGLATSVGTAVGVVVLLGYFVKLERYVGFDARELKPDSVSAPASCRWFSCRHSRSHLPRAPSRDRTSGRPIPNACARRSVSRSSTAQSSWESSRCSCNGVPRRSRASSRPSPA